MSGLVAAAKACGVSRRELLSAQGQELTVVPADDPSVWPARLRKRVHTVPEPQRSAVVYVE